MISRPVPSPVLLAIVLAASLALEACKGCKNESNIVVDDDDDDDEEVEEIYDNDWGSWLSLGVLSDGSPVAAYYDRTQTALGFALATFEEDGTVSWTHEEVDGYPNDDGLDPGDRGKYASMAVAADDTVWVVYQDTGNQSLSYAMRSADGTWTTGNADVGGGSSPDAGQFATLALDGEGAPVAAHYDVGKGQLRVAHYSTGTSSFSGDVVDEGEAPAADTGSEPVEADVGQYASIAISGGVEYIAYYDVANGDLKLAWGPAGDYTIETIDSDGDVGQWPDVMVDDGTVHIAYHDVGNQDLKYVVGEPGAWTIETVDEGEYVGADTALFQNGSYPAIVYFDGRNNDMMMAWRSGEDWQIDTVTGSDGALGFHNEVISVNGTPYGGCYDYTNRVLWFDQLN